MVAARNALRGLAATEEGPAELLGHLNYAACHLTEGIAGTVVCGRYDPQTRVLHWARAGHLPPVLVRDGAARALPLPDGVLLGLDPDAQYEEASTQLRVGDTLLLFTDGLIERRSGSISDALRDFTADGRPGRPGRPVARRPHPRRRDIRHRRRRLPGRRPHRLAPARPASKSGRGGESAMRKRRAPASPRGCPVPGARPRTPPPASPALALHGNDVRMTSPIHRQPHVPRRITRQTHQNDAFWPTNYPRPSRPGGTTWPPPSTTSSRAARATPGNVRPGGGL